MPAEVVPTPTDPRAILEIQKLEADIQKARADREKAELESRELKHWYFRPAILQPWAAIVLGVVTALIGTASGWFSTKLESLNNKEAEVQRKIDLLVSGRSDLNAQIKSMTAQRDDLQARLTQVSSEAAQLSARVNALQQEAGKADEYKADLQRLKTNLAQVSVQAKDAAKPNFAVVVESEKDPKRAIDSARIQKGEAWMTTNGVCAVVSAWSSSVGEANRLGADLVARGLAKEFFVAPKDLFTRRIFPE